MELNRLLDNCLQPLDLPAKERTYLVCALLEAVNKRVEELSCQVDTARQHSEEFTAKYRMDYDRFVEFCKGKNSPELGTDLINWGFWERISSGRSTLIARYEQLKGLPSDC